MPTFVRVSSKKKSQRSSGLLLIEELVYSPSLKIGKKKSPFVGFVTNQHSDLPFSHFGPLVRQSPHIVNSLTFRYSFNCCGLWQSFLDSRTLPRSDKLNCLSTPNVIGFCDSGCCHPFVCDGVRSEVKCK